LGSLDEIRRFYEAREMAIHDEITRITGAREEGLLTGEAKGRLEDVRKMLLKNIDENLIVEITELPLKQIKILKAEISGEIH
jgi:predicted transposase/invertase (TIGR01784 family)